MLKKLSLIIVCLIAPWSFSEACSIPQDYYPSEYDDEKLKTRNLIKDSSTILTGHFVKTKKGKPLTFRIDESIEPKKTPFIFKNKKVEFLDVRNVYFSAGKEEDNGQFTNPSTLEALLDYYSGKPVEPMVSNYLAHYWGGPLAGIHHGSDCERFVQIYEGDEYIIFLDKNNIINARFTLPAEPNELLRTVTTQLENFKVTP